MELITIATENASKIAKATKSCRSDHYTCVYIHQGDLKIVHLQKGWWVQEPSLDFHRAMTKAQVLEAIQEWKEMEDNMWGDEYKK